MIPASENRVDLAMVSPSTLSQIDQLASAFADAQPFKHVAIDGFLDPDCAARLLHDFPSFEARYALNENGEVGGKAVRMDMASISPQFTALHELLRSSDFLALIGRITGIPELLFDPDYIGGGTHENVHGQGLDPHVDFNILPTTGWHRRLNLILYLNPQWEASWGGCLDLERDPWQSETDRVRIAPLLNRCVIFETTESSWHGFDAIRLPETARELSRKSIAIYYYTREREAAQTAPSHATVYVPRGMPEGLREGTALDASDLTLLSQRFAQLRGQLRFLYRRELDFAEQLKRANQALDEARAASGFPLQGFVTLAGGAAGYWPDGWCARSLALTFTPTRAARGLLITVWVPDAIATQTLRFSIADYSGTLDIRSGSSASAQINLPFKARQSCTLRVHASHDWQPHATGGGDLRPLAYRLIEAVLE